MDNQKIASELVSLAESLTSKTSLGTVRIGRNVIFLKFMHGTKEDGRERFKELSSVIKSAWRKLYPDHNLKIRYKDSKEINNRGSTMVETVGIMDITPDLQLPPHFRDEKAWPIYFALWDAIKKAGFKESKS